MSIISQDLLDKLNKKKPGPGADPSELEKFNKEYDAVLKELEKKKAEEEKEGDASHIPGDPPDSDDEDPSDHSADHIPD